MLETPVDSRLRIPIAQSMHQNPSSGTHSHFPTIPTCLLNVSSRRTVVVTLFHVSHDEHPVVCARTGWLRHIEKIQQALKTLQRAEVRVGKVLRSQFAHLRQHRRHRHSRLLVDTTRREESICVGPRIGNRFLQ